MSIDAGEDVIAHLEKDLWECHAASARNENNSHDWWVARASGIAHAIDLIRARQTEKVK